MISISFSNSSRHAGVDFEGLICCFFDQALVQETLNSSRLSPGGGQDLALCLPPAVGRGGSNRGRG